MKNNSTKQFLLVEPIAATPYPPLGLLKISTWLKKNNPGCSVFTAIGKSIPEKCVFPDQIYITSLFTWHVDKLIKIAQFYSDKYPRAEIKIGGIAASLLPEYIESKTGIRPHIGLLNGAESCAPDYTLDFGRSEQVSISYTTRGCPRKCRFCSVSIHEPIFTTRNHWEKDINTNYSKIVFWDNNWLASPNFLEDCKKLRRINKNIDFNQGLDARLFSNEIAKELSTIKISPIRFAFDNAKIEKSLMKAVSLSKKYSINDIRVYVLYNYDDSPDDFYYRINLLNKNGILCFPMEYRPSVSSTKKVPGKNWNIALLRAMKLSLLYYYHRGMITKSRESFLSIYGNSPKRFISKLYSIFEYDKKLKRKSKK